MNKTKQLQIILRPAAGQNSQKQPWWWAEPLLYTFLLTAGLGQLLGQVSDWAVSGLVLAGIALAVSLAAVLLSGSRWSDWSVPAAVLLAALWCVGLHRQVWGGTQYLANQFLTWLMGRTRHIFLLYDGADAADCWAALVPVLILTAAIGCRCAIRGRRWSLVFYLLPGAAVAAGWVDFGLGATMLALALLLRMIRLAAIGKSFQSFRDFFRRSVLLGSACLVALGGCLLLASLWDQDSAEVRQKLTRELDELRYGQSSMPRGELTQLDAWQPGTQIALQITMDQPQKLYLRGYIGERYTPQRWQPLEPQTYAEQADLFFWLHQNDFFGQSILAGAYEATGATSTAQMTVENLGAADQTVFVPYHAKLNLLADEWQIGDLSLKPHGDTETFSYYPGSIPQWFELQNQLSESTVSTPELQRFRSSEQAYSEYVQQVYLSLTPQVETTLQQELGVPAQELTLSQIKDTILAYFNEHITYDPTASTDLEGADFLTTFLQEQTRGYSVHYATAATLMLRYFGIPARYCEGYFLSAEQAQMCSSHVPFTLDETHAHAWTEYYLPGVGWLPFEVTPGYVDREELAGEGAGGGGMQYAAPQPEPELLKPETPQETGGTRAAGWWFGWLWILPVLLVLGLLVWVIGKRVRLRRFLRQMAQAAPSQAVTLQIAYGMYLLKCSGLSGQQATLDGLQYPSIRQLQQEALFSDHTMTQQQMAHARGFLQQVQSLCRQHWKLHQRLFYRWIRGIYE